MTRSILDVKGIGPATAKVLAEHGFQSAQQLARTEVAQLAAVPGFSETRAAQVIAAAKSLDQEVKAAVAEMPKEESKPEKGKKEKKDKSKDKKSKKSAKESKKSDKKLKKSKKDKAKKSKKKK